MRPRCLVGPLRMPRELPFYVFAIVALGCLLGTMLLIALINEGALLWLTR